MVVDWEQETGLLMSSGDVRIVRIWDTEREMKVQVTAPAPLEGLDARPGTLGRGARVSPGPRKRDAVCFSGCLSFRSLGEGGALGLPETCRRSASRDRRGHRRSGGQCGCGRGPRTSTPDSGRASASPRRALGLHPARDSDGHRAGPAQRALRTCRRRGGATPCHGTGGLLEEQ